MTPELKKKISDARSALEADAMGIVAGEIRSGNSAQKNIDFYIWKPYFEFLSETNGGRFGSIDIWSSDEYSNRQYQTVDFPGASDRWIVIGQILYEPLALEAKTGKLYLFRRDGDLNGEYLGLFDYFFTNVVFGCDYTKIIPDGDKDEWWSILGDAGLR